MEELAKLVGKKAYKAFQADPVTFVRAFDREPWPFQADILRQVLEREAGKFTRPIAVVSMPRQNGKSTLSAWVALWRFFCEVEHQDIITVALDRSSASIILNDARRIIQASSVLMEMVDPDWGLTKWTIRLVDGRSWSIRSADSAYSRGYRPTTVLYDELGWSADDGALFQVLSASQAAQENPLMLVTSTVGPIQAGPLWELFQAAESGDPAVRLIYHTENLSPKISPQFLERQRRILPPMVYAREHQNLWGEGADLFCTVEDWERATSDYDPLLPRDPGPTHAFVDLGWSHDETAIAIAKPDMDGKTDIIYLRGIRGSRARPVSLPLVERKLEELVGQYGVRRLVIESPQGVAMAQSLNMRGVQAEVLHPTAKSNSARWGALYAALKAGQIRLPRDKLLRRQLLTLTIKESLTGWRVIDVPSIHQDRAVAVAGALYACMQGDPRGDWVIS
jgi:hypothetical protein